MTSMFEPNRDEMTTPLDNVATGPRVGFLDNFETAYEAQRRASSMFGIERGVNDIDNAQVTALRGQGVEGVPTLNGQGLETAKFYEDGGDENQINKFKAYDERINALKKQYPDLKLKDSSEIWSNVKLSAQEAERRSATDRTTAGGDVGGFAGGAIASLDPRTDPLNFITAPIGGLGKTVVGRVAAQGAVQGLTEGINQLTGVQTERRLLGLEHGFTDALARVGGAAIGGAVLQGAGEAVAKGIKVAGRRWFTPGKNDVPPAPPIERPPEYAPLPKEPTADELKVRDLLNGTTAYDQLPRDINPYGLSRIAEARSVLDTDHVTQRLEDWSGEAPAFIEPKTLTAIPRDVEPGVNFSEDFTTRKALGQLTVDEMARANDPATFTIYDKLAAQKQQLRAEMDVSMKNVQPVSHAELQTVHAAVDDLSSRINDLAEQRDAGGLSNRKVNDLNKRIDQLTQERNDNMARINHVAGPDAAAARAEFDHVDGQMRDLAPVVSRAYAHARGEWGLSQEYKDAVRDMVKSGGRTVKEPIAAPRSGESGVIPLYKQTLRDKAPILHQSDKVESKMRPDADAADYASAIVKENMKVLDDAMEAYRTGLAKILKEDNGEIKIGGTDLTLRLDDKIAIPHEEGTGGKLITVRELLQQNLETEEDLRATKTCST